MMDRFLFTTPKPMEVQTMRKAFTYAPIGSISHGTLRLEDLLSAFADALDSLAAGVNAAHTELANDAWELVAVGEENWSVEQELDADETLMDLETALHEYAPPFAYFGSHPGDPTDYGFWFDNEALRRATLNDDGAYDVDGFRLQISDHGSVDIYDANGNRVLSVV